MAGNGLVYPRGLGAVLAGPFWDPPYQSEYCSWMLHLTWENRHFSVVYHGVVGFSYLFDTAEHWMAKVGKKCCGKRACFGAHNATPTKNRSKNVSDFLWKQAQGVGLQVHEASFSYLLDAKTIGPKVWKGVTAPQLTLVSMGKWRKFQPWITFAESICKLQKHLYKVERVEILKSAKFHSNLMARSASNMHFSYLGQRDPVSEAKCVFKPLICILRPL